MNAPSCFQNLQARREQPEAAHPDTAQHEEDVQPQEVEEEPRVNLCGAVELDQVKDMLLEWIHSSEG